MTPHIYLSEIQVTLNDEMTNVSVNQLPQFYKSLRVPCTFSIAVVTWYTPQTSIYRNIAIFFDRPKDKNIIILFEYEIWLKT